MLLVKSSGLSMGEAKERQYSRAAFLRRHPLCCYCGATATTTDHCPPRAMFRNREWPEGYEFPACHACNQQGRLDEQVVATFAKAQAVNLSGSDYADWQRLLSGLRNNQPELYAEWSIPGSRNELRHAMRANFGDLAENLRMSGHGVLMTGPLTHEALTRFGVKLAQALYYKNIGHILIGQAWTRHFNPARVGWHEALDQALTIAPGVSLSERSGRDLREQFVYRFNVKEDDTPLIYAVAMLSPQMVYVVVGASRAFLQSVHSEPQLPLLLDKFEVTDVAASPPLGVA